MKTILFWIKDIYLISDRQYGINNKNKSKILEKLSSGYRINRAGDDAAGLAISEEMRRNIWGMKQGINNAQDGIGLVRTAEGAMQEISSMLLRMHQLAVEASNDTYTDKERYIIQDEVNQLKEEINRISNNTEFNGVSLFKKEYTQIPRLIISGTAAIRTDTYLPDWVIKGKSFEEGKMLETFNIYDPIEPYKGSLGQDGGGGKGIRWGGSLDFSEFTADDIEDLIGKGFHSTCITCNRHLSIKFVHGNSSFRMSSAGQHYIEELGIDGVKTGEELVNRIVSIPKGIWHTDLGKPIKYLADSHFIRLQQDPNNGAVLLIYDMRQAYTPTGSVGPVGTISDIKDGKIPQPWFGDPGYGKINYGVAYHYKETVAPPPVIEEDGDLSIQLGASKNDRLWVDLPTVSVKSLNIKKVSVLSHKKSSQAIKTLERAIDLLNTERGKMGAYENRLEHSIRSIENTYENMTAAESHIRDTDMALIATNLAKEEILEQATLAMLTQANGTAQSILSLLKI